MQPNVASWFPGPALPPIDGSKQWLVEKDKSTDKQMLSHVNPMGLSREGEWPLANFLSRTLKIWKDTWGTGCGSVLRSHLTLNIVVEGPWRKSSYPVMGLTIHQDLRFHFSGVFSDVTFELAYLSLLLFSGLSPFQLC